MKIDIHEDKAGLGKHAAHEGAKLLRAAINANGYANMIIATGASQFEMLAALAQEPDIAWNRITGFHLDEYVGLPITHPASFRTYLWKRFISQLPLPLADFHYVNGDEPDPQAECKWLGEIIREHPIDVAFVGIGENGHLAFNDPPANFDTEEPYIVVDLDDACRRQQLGEGWFPSFEAVPSKAISMSINQIMASRAIICSVPDQRKAEAVRNSVEGPVSNKVPASILQKHSNCQLHLDRPAATLLHKK